MAEVGWDRPHVRLAWWTERQGVLLISCIVAAFYFGTFWRLLLTNLDFPWALDDGSTPAMLAISILSLTSGGIYVLGISAVWRASKTGLAVVLTVTLLVAWSLYPVACDTHESFADTPNKVCDCSGVTLSYYPQGTMDGAETEYCIGLERDVS